MVSSRSQACWDSRRDADLLLSTGGAPGNLRTCFKKTTVCPPTTNYLCSSLVQNTLTSFHTPWKAHCHGLRPRHEVQGLVMCIRPKCRSALCSSKILEYGVKKKNLKMCELKKEVSTPLPTPGIQPWGHLESRSMGSPWKSPVHSTSEVQLG